MKKEKLANSFSKNLYIAADLSKSNDIEKLVEKNSENLITG